MRSRSSRLFIVLIHLVGVSTNLPHNTWSNTPFWQGIRGVHPMAIFLESLQLPGGADGGLDELLTRLRAAGYVYPEDEVLNEPFWLQDDTDGLCLGPGGTFGQCGDASLWLVRKRRRRRRGRDGRSVLSRLVTRGADGSNDNDEASVWGYALELVDVSAGRRLRRDGGNDADANVDAEADHSNEEGECLVSKPASYDADQERTLRLGSCASNEAWVWRISGDGVLSQDQRAISLSLTRRQRQEQISQRRQQKQRQRHSQRQNSDDGRQAIVQRPADPLRRLLLDSAPQVAPNGMDADSSLLLDEGTRANCIWRVNASAAMATQCAVDQSEAPATASAQSDEKRLVNFSLIRYQTSTDSARLPILPEEPEEDSASAIASSDNDDAKVQLRGCSSTNDEDNSSPTACQSHPVEAETSPPIVVPAMFPELKPASQLLFGGTPSPSAIKTNNKRSQRTRPAKVAASASFSSHMVGASPLTLGAVAYPRSSKLGAGLPGSAAASSLVGPDANRNLLHYPPSQSSVQSPIPHGDAPHKVRKIPKHPYIEASNDGVWVDDETGLEYLTDLSDYLGHDRKETGRHTLMGVGQYTRTVFKIKVSCCCCCCCCIMGFGIRGYLSFLSIYFAYQ